MNQKEPLFDVVAINIKTNEQRLPATGKTEDNADAIVTMAVMRRGVEEEFYKAVPTGTALVTQTLKK